MFLCSRANYILWSIFLIVHNKFCWRILCVLVTHRLKHNIPEVILLSIILFVLISQSYQLIKVHNIIRYLQSQQNVETHSSGRGHTWQTTNVRLIWIVHLDFLMERFLSLLNVFIIICIYLYRYTYMYIKEKNPETQRLKARTKKSFVLEIQVQSDDVLCSVRKYFVLSLPSVQKCQLCNTLLYKSTSSLSFPTPPTLYMYTLLCTLYTTQH